MTTHVPELPYPSDLRLTVHAAGPNETAIVLDLMNECCAWLSLTGKGHNDGADQWPERFELADIQDQLDGDEFYFAHYDGQLAATFGFTDHAQWYGQVGSNDEMRQEIAGRMNVTQEELKDTIRQVGLDQPAMYWHSFAVRRSFAGQGLGRKLLAWGEDAARHRNFRYLRLDCHHVNRCLRQYYVDAGFQSLHVIAENPFGGIFQKELDLGTSAK